MKNKSGQSLIELLIIIGLFAVLLPALVVGFIASGEGKAQMNQRLDATAFLKEAEEAVRSVREKGWTSFAVNGIFHPEIVGSAWSLVAGNDTINDFTRTIEISDVLRDSSGTIVNAGGAVDPSTKKITITLSWSLPLPSSVQSSFYLTRFDNLSYTQTTFADFDAGVKNGVVVTNTAGGEVVLGAGGGGNWCEPSLNITPLDLPKQGVANAVTAIEGRIFAGTGDNSSGESFVNINVSNTHPPVATILATFDGYKTNDIFGEANYGYIATDTNSKEIVIIDLTTVPYTEIGYFNAPGSTDATAVFVLGNIGYMIQGTKLRNFDLSSKSGSRPAIDSDGVDLFGVNGTSVYVSGNYAYVTLYGKSVLVVNISNASNLWVASGINPHNRTARDIIANSTGTRAYFINDVSSTQDEFYIYKWGVHGWQFVGSYDTSGMQPKAIAIVPGNRAIIVGMGNEEYQVVDISDETNPVRCGGLQINTGINGVASVLEADGDAYSYIITGDASSELKIIEGGPGGFYASAGVFESSIFDSSYQTAFNRMLFTAVKPPATDIKFQIAVVDDAGGSCAGAVFNYVGPDGTPATFFTNPEALFLDDDGAGFENPGRCFRYKAFLSTNDSFTSPVLNDFTVNYSP